LGFIANSAEGSQVSFSCKRYENWARSAEGLPTKLPYNPNSEALPDHEFYRIDRSQFERHVVRMVQAAQNDVRDVQTEGQEMERLRQGLEKCKTVPAIDDRTIAFVGATGIGKSSLINAVLSRPGLAKSSSDGHACTLYATKYVWKCGAEDNARQSNFKIVTLNADSWKAILKEHISDYTQFHFKTERDDPDFEEMRNRAQVAKDMFHLVCGTKIPGRRAHHKLQARLNLEDIQEGKLLQHLLDESASLKEEAGVDAAGCITFTDVSDHGGQLDNVRSIADRIHCGRWWICLSLRRATSC
jgi:hypothetical protein